MNDLCNRLSDILLHEAGEVTYSVARDMLIADLDCFALTGTAAGKVADLAAAEHRTYIVTIQSIVVPKMQLQISL